MACHKGFIGRHNAKPYVLKGHNMTNLNFPATLANATTSHVKAITAAEKSAVKMLDVYRAEQVPASHLISPRSKESTCPSQDWYDGLRAAVVAGFSADEKRILKAPTASLSDGGKKEKAKVQGKIGSTIKDIKNGLLRNPDGKSPTQPKTGLDKASADFLAYLGKVQKYEDMPFDIVEMTALLKAMGNKFNLK
jgi:hypothetical protein